MRFAAVIVVAAGCRLGVSPGLVGRFDRGSQEDRHPAVNGVILAELGGYVPYKASAFGAFVTAGVMAKEGPDDHTRWGGVMGDLRYRHVYRDTPERRRSYWAVGVSGGAAEPNDGIGGTYAELGFEYVRGPVSFDLSVRHRFLIQHEPGYDLWRYLNVFSIGLAFGAAH